MSSPVTAPRPQTEVRARPAVVFVWVLLGTLALQAAWILTVPPFRDSDEHDHAYRAADVARGDWSTTHPVSPYSAGELVRVPRDIVDAAGPVCRGFLYTTADNCNPVQDLGHGQVSVVSSAARYNPVFYFVIGTAARPFHGAHALYAMRAMASLLCALLIAAAAGVTAMWARSRWPMVGLLLAATPVVVFSTSVAAPNGVEMSSAMLLWTALIGIARLGVTDGRAPRLVAWATAAAVPLVTVRTLGPVWCLCIVACTAILMPRRELVALLRLRVTLLGAAVVALATAPALWWSLASGTNQPGSGAAPPAASTTDVATQVQSVYSVLPRAWMLWFFQSLAAFPERDEPAPPIVYAIGLLVIAVVALIALRRAVGRERLAMLSVLAVGTAVPVAVTIATFKTDGTLWQGRYTLPFTMGFLLLVGASLDRSTGTHAGLDRMALRLVATSGILMEVISQRHVLLTQLASSPLRHSSEWIRPSSLEIALLVVVGSGAVLAGLSSGSRSAAVAVRADRPAVGRADHHLDHARS